jgi:ABC-type transport system substrate-binding protein
MAPEQWPNARAFLRFHGRAIIPEYANRLAQFLARQHRSSRAINAEDLPNTVQAAPNVRIEARTGPTLSFSFFGPEDISTGWAKDPRVRQAVSMSYNRDDLMELGYNVQEASRGRPSQFENPWHNLLPAGDGLVDRSQGS